MFGVFKKMFVGLLSTCTLGSFVGSLVSISKGTMKRATLDQHSNEVLFINLPSVLINVGKVVMLLMIHMLDYVFQIK